MSSYTVSTKRKLTTYLDNAGAILGLSRLEDEALVDYKERLIDHVKNRGNATITGVNVSLAREAGQQRTHVLTIEPLASVSEPYISVTSKYLRLMDGDTLDIELDLYTNTISDLNDSITSSSTMFEVTYFDNDLENESARKLFYGNNLKYQRFEVLKSSKLNRFDNTYIKSLTFSSTMHRYSKASIAEVVGINDYYLDNKEGLLYTGQNASDAIGYLYYEIPFELFYTPISFFPLNDEDVDEIIKDTLYTEDGDTFLVTNSKGAEWINTLLQAHPLTWGE